MGQTGAGNAQIEHQVTLTKGFYLGKYEVTKPSTAVIQIAMASVPRLANTGVESSGGEGDLIFMFE